MEAFRRLTLALAAVALAGLGCGDDDGDDNPNPRLDASVDSSIDSMVPPGNDAGDAGSFACTTSSAPTATMCGGSHCLQTPAQLRSSITSGAACSKPEELDQFCQLSSVTKVQGCILQNLGATDRSAAVKTCAAPMLPDYTSSCLDCFVASAVCAAEKCLQQCAADPSAPACDTCRVQQGCIGSFYTCAGIDNPLPGM
jgi:hypothetical protein